jgi:hypothetical protein
MTVLVDIGRYLAYVGLLWLYAVAITRLLLGSQRARRNGKRLVARLWEFAQSVVVWEGLFIVIYPITRVISVTLLLLALTIPVIASSLSWLAPKLLRVRENEKSSIASASELAAARHPWLARLTAFAQQPLSFLLPLLVVGLVVLVVARGDLETTMFRATFGTLFAIGIPTVMSRAVIMTMPVLDDNSRDMWLAIGLAAMVTQILQLGLVLTSLSVPRTNIALGISGASFLVSIPLLVAVLVYFAFATAVPYAVGVRAASRLRQQFVHEQQETMERLSTVLTVPKSDLYDAQLCEIQGTVSESIRTLKLSYFYLDFGIDRLPDTVAGRNGRSTLIDARSDQTTEKWDPLPAGPVDFARIDRFLFRKFGGIDRAVVADGDVARDDIIEGSVFEDGEPSAEIRGEGLHAVDAPANRSLDDELLGAATGSALVRAGELPLPDATENGGNGSSEWPPQLALSPPPQSGLAASENPTYGEVLKRIAVARGWSDTDPRMELVRMLAQSFEQEARHVDPSFIHSRWLERVRQLTANIREDLATREAGTAREVAAGLWSNAASKLKIELGEEGHGTKPRAVVVITTVSGFVLTAVSKAAVTGVWHVFHHTPHS